MDLLILHMYFTVLCSVVLKSAIHVIVFMIIIKMQKHRM